MSSSTQKATIPNVQEHLRKLRRSRMQELLGHEPLQTTILSCIINPLDLNVVKNTYTLLGLRKIHSEAIKRIDSSLNENVDLLLNTNADQLLNHLPTPLKPTVAYPSKLVITPEELVSIRNFPPLNNRSPSPVVFKQIQQTEQRNPYPSTWSPSVEQIFLKKPPADRRTVINLSNDSDKPIEHIPTEPFITRETRQRAKTHDCTICNKRGYDEVHCHCYQCKFCHDNAPGHLPSECLKNPAPFHHHHHITRLRPRCTLCGKIRHHWMKCRDYQCISCHKDASGHETSDCPEDYQNRYAAANSITVNHPIFPPGMISNEPFDDEDYYNKDAEHNLAT